MYTGFTIYGNTVTIIFRGHCEQSTVLWPSLLVELRLAKTERRSPGAKWAEQTQPVNEAPWALPIQVTWLFASFTRVSSSRLSSSQRGMQERELRVEEIYSPNGASSPTPASFWKDRHYSWCTGSQLSNVYEWVTETCFNTEHRDFSPSRHHRFIFIEVILLFQL